MMRDVPGHLVVLLVDVAVEHRHVRVRHQQVDHLCAVARGPVPLRIEIEQRPVREHHDGRMRGHRAQVRRQPCQLRLAHARGRVRHVVDGDEMHALVIEGVVCAAEQFAVGGTVVQRSVVLARHVVHHRYLEAGGDVAELRQAAAPFVHVFGDVGQVAGEHHEIGRRR